MRVLHIGKYYPPFAGGIENFMADLLPALHNEGIVVAALVHDEQPSRGGLWPQSSDPFPVYRAPCYGRMLYVPMSPAFPLWLHRAIRAFRPDILHLHLPNPSAFWALAVPAARKLPWVIHWHADVVGAAHARWIAAAYRLYRPFEQQLLARSRAVFVTSPPYLAASTALAPWHDRCHILPLGLATKNTHDPIVQTHAETLWGNAPFRVLSIGRLTAYKGHAVLIRAAVGLGADGRVLIVGTGERRAALQALIAELGVSDRVQLLGFQSDADRNALLSSCDVLCLPSLDRGEAFGVVLLEAMQAGKPVVASDIPGSGVGWVIRTAGHGVLTPPGDSHALTTALHALQCNPAERIALGHHGAHALQARFSITPVARAMAHIYRSVLQCPIP